MIIGAHTVINSVNPEADRAFFRDVLKFPNVDVGNGWLIFALPPSEVAVHPSEGNNANEFFLMCDDLRDSIRQMRSAGIKCAKIQKPSWGLRSRLQLPGGGEVGVYQPLHERPTPLETKARSVAAARSRTVKSTKQG